MYLLNIIEVKQLSKHFHGSQKKPKKGPGQGPMQGSGGGLKQGKQPEKLQAGENSKKVIKAVDNIDFEVRQGEIFGFLGPNGAGKTTSIRMMTGVLKPTAGHIKIFNRDFWKNPIPIKQKMGHVPEMANVYMDLTGLENLSFIGEIYGISKKERYQRAAELLKQFGIFESRDLKAKKYSKGMKQRLLLCMALMNKPQILFLDEPTSGLDVQSSRIIKKTIKGYNKEGMTIFMTTHDMSVANEMCDRIAIINKGKIVRLDTPDNLRKLEQEYQAINFYFEQEINPQEFTQLEDVKKVEKTHDYYHFVVDDLNAAMYNILDYAKSKNLKIKSVNTHQPSLEDVFIKIINGEN